MHVFVTGATGFIGAAIVEELIGAGHEVTGLARSDKSASLLTATGARVHRGDVEDLDSLRSGVTLCDAVIHTAFNHDFSKFKENCEADRRAIEAMGAVLAGSNKPLVVTSGIAILPPGRMADEDTLPDPGSAIPRKASEEAAAAVSANGVHVSVVRLPPSVHGDGDHGFVPMIIGSARDKGVSAYVGDGLNRWPAVHRLDAARLYRLVLEKGLAGAKYHCIADEGVPFRDIAGAIGQRLNIPVVSKLPEEAADHFGWLAHFVTLDIAASGKRTREELSWQPKEAGLIEDLDKGSYF